MNTFNYKVCILAAGKGTRNTSVKGIHKSLLPLENKAIISHIIEKFHPNIEIVIAVGYQSEQVKSFINYTHADRKISFVDVQNYDKEGSGPGLSLLTCGPHLQCPFIFTAADTITEEHYLYNNLLYDWVGYSNINVQDSFRYCLIDGENYLNKFYFGYGEKAFIGLAGVYEYKKFWEKLENSILLKKEKQTFLGFENTSNVHLKSFKWYDTGNNESYLKARNRFCNDIVPNKNDEILFIQNDKVIKYFYNERKVDMRIERIKYLNGSVPSVSKINDNMYSYDFIPGKMLAEIYDEKVLRELIPLWYKQLGIKRFEKTEEFMNDCISMYKDKTFKRCKYFADTELDNIQYINGLKVEKIYDMLNKIDWNSIYDHATPSYFHGDITPENVIYSDNNKFIMLDWRESFGESLKIGDLYYDLGKLHHSLLLNNTDVRHRMYKIEIKEDSAHIFHHARINLLFLLDQLKEFCMQKHFSFSNIEILSILQYLGISSLYQDFHGGEYGKFLFLYGKYLLTKYLNYDKRIS